MAIGYDLKVVRQLTASTDLTKYQIVKQDTDAGDVTVCGAGEQPYGIAMAAVSADERVDVVTEGSYFAKTSAGIARGSNLAVAALGTLVTATSAHAFTLGVLGDDQAATTTAGEYVKVVIDKQVVSIA